MAQAILNDSLIPLSNESLASLPNHIKRPLYDRSALSAGIVHIGLGNFHRAHQAWYLHRLMQSGQALDWAIIGAGVRSYDQAQREKLASQDYLTTLIELDPKGRSAEVCGSMIDYVPIQDGNASLIERMAQSDIRIVALTVTEGGYYIDPVTKGFDANHPDIIHDAANPDTPRTAFGAMISALRIRRAAGLGPFTGQSCDNLQGNGAILRQTVVSLAQLSDPDLATWIDENCTFPNSMVDCIVPVTGPKEIALAASFGIDDQSPVTHENFRQWVIEDDFCAGRPNWEDAGATLSNDVHSFEAMKIRILNGGHQVVSNPGEILSMQSISECMADPQIVGLFRKIAIEEVSPHVSDVTGMTPARYVDLIHERFSNPEIIDTVRRVAFDGSSRHTGFILPVVHEAIQAGTKIDGLALSQALWARMCEGTREDGTLIEANDPFWDQLTGTAKAAKSTPLVWLEQRHYYGDIADNAPFVDRFTYWLALIWSQGTRAAISEYLNS